MRTKFRFFISASLFLWGASSQAAVLFQEAVSLQAGQNPRGVAAGDLQGRGFQSFVVANFGSPTFIGQSTPQSFLNGSLSNLQVFDPSPSGLHLSATIPTASSPRGLFLFDLASGGRQDILVTNYDSNLIQVFHWNGGRFEKIDEESTGKMPVGVAAGYLRAGGAPFVAVADYGSNEVSIYPVVGGRLGERVDIPLDAGPAQVAVGNLGGDGKCEIAVACLAADKIDILSMGGLGEDAASFHVTKTLALPAGSSPSDLAVGDLNGDGLADLAVVSFLKNTLNLYFQGPAGIFTAQPPLPTSGLHPNGLALSDLNGDGRLEVIVANRDSDSLDIFEPMGSLFQLGQTLKLPADSNGAFGPVEVAVLDTTGDGVKDIVVSHMRSNSLRVFKGQSIVGGSPTETPTATPDSEGGKAFNDTTVYCYPDPTRDGKLKICFGLPSQSSVLIRIYDLTGSLVWSQSLDASQTRVGDNVLPWEGMNQAGQNLASGLYLCRISAGDKTITKKISIFR